MDSSTPLTQTVLRATLHHIGTHLRPPAPDLGPPGSSGAVSQGRTTVASPPAGTSPSQRLRAPLVALLLTPGPHVEKAAAVVDEGSVRQVVCPSGRRIVQVRGKGETYLVLGKHYCSCKSFFFDGISREEGMCKHLLATEMADALGEMVVTHVSDEEMADLLLTHASTPTNVGR